MARSRFVAVSRLDSIACWRGRRSEGRSRTTPDSRASVQDRYDDDALVQKKQKCPGIVIDAVRCAKLALDREIAGPLEAASAYMMTPPLVDELAPEKQWAFGLGLCERHVS